MADIPATMVWRRARVSFMRDGKQHVLRRVRLVVEHEQVRVLDATNGSMLAEATINGGSKMSARLLVLATTDGEEWRCEQMGCGCGGGTNA